MAVALVSVAAIGRVASCPRVLYVSFSCFCLVLYLSCERHKEVRPRLDTPASLWSALARCGRSSHIQAWGDGVQVLAWPGTGLSVWAVNTGRSSCWTTASSFRQPPSTRCSTLSARCVQPSHLRCRWTNDMERVPKQFAWAGHANWLFSSYTEDVTFWSVLGTLSALEALFATMRYINWHLHLHLLRGRLVGLQGRLGVLVRSLRIIRVVYHVNNVSETSDAGVSLGMSCTTGH